MTTDPSLRLPATFVHIQGLLEGEKKPNSFVNVVGLSIDCQAPIATRGTGANLGSIVCKFPC
jgi:hypothetical protein